MPIPTAAYCRVSTEREDQRQSLESQIRYFRDYIDARPQLSLVEVYADRGLSGTTVAVITSDFHCFRAHLIAQRAGLSAMDIPAKSPYALLNANYYVREAFALCKTLIFD